MAGASPAVRGRQGRGGRQTDAFRCSRQARGSPVTVVAHGLGRTALTRAAKPPARRPVGPPLRSDSSRARSAAYRPRLERRRLASAASEGVHRHAGHPHAGAAEEIIERGRKRGEVDPTTDARLVVLTMGGLIHLHTTHLGTDIPATLPDQAVALILPGITPPRADAPN
ncbi:TetR-like C-terminal domain-containing protein [Streptomyces sp. NPDC002143]